MDKAICEMSIYEIENEISVRQFELLDSSIDNAYRRYCSDRINALLMELAIKEHNR